jgi:hypothetical protein
MMSTRSRIGLLEEGGAVRSIYVHYDGYPEGVGAVLAKHYTRAADVSALLAGGDTSYPAEHPDDCDSLTAYAAGPTAHTTREAYAEDAARTWAEWLYLASPDGSGGVTWEVLDVGEGRTWEPLPAVLAARAAQGVAI